MPIGCRVWLDHLSQLDDSLLFDRRLLDVHSLLWIDQWSWYGLCVYIASFTSLGFYFDQWVSFAAGLASAGSSFGYLILPPISLKLLAGLPFSSSKVQL